MKTQLYVSPAPRLKPLSYTPTTPKRPKQSDDGRILALSVTLTLAFIIAIGLPLAAFLPPRLIDHLPINVVVPLHFAPSPGAWNKLYESLIKHADLNFTIIVNPASGVGTPPYPGPLYENAISRLKSFSNARIVGYINTNNGTRGNGTVNEQIAVYAGWAEKPALAIDGIFFDKTPTADSHVTREYCRNISETVKLNERFRPHNLVIHNAGKVPVANYSTPFVDITIVFEGAFADVPSREMLRRELGNVTDGRREKFGMLVHSMPKKLGRVGLRKLVNGVRREVQYLYVTDLREEVYGGFGGLWETFLGVLW